MKGSSGAWRKRLKMTVPSALRQKGEEQCDDVIKLFLTIHPIALFVIRIAGTRRRDDTR